MKRKTAAHLPELGRAAYERLASRGRRGRTADPARGGRTVLVTGAYGYWGGRLLTALENDRSIGTLIGTSSQAPGVPASGRIEIVRMPVKSPFLVDLLAQRKVDVVVHLDWLEEERSRERMVEANVLGSRHVLSACQDAGVAKLVVRSSTAVYGALPDNPCFLVETRPLRSRTRDPLIRDLLDCEADWREFVLSGARPLVTILRFAHIVGPSAPTPMNRFLRRKKIGTVLGFDPMLQFIHEDDVVAALAAAVHRDVAGAVNVAAPGLLPMTRVAALLGKKTSPAALPWFPRLMKIVHQLPPVRRPPFPLEHLKFLCCGETVRMRDELKLSPEYSGRAAIESLATGAPRVDDGAETSGPAYAGYIQKCLDEVLEKGPGPARPARS